MQKLNVWLAGEDKKKWTMKLFLFYISLQFYPMKLTAKL